MVYFDFIPITAPEELEKLMQKILPFKLLYPLRDLSKTSSTQSQEAVRQSPISKPQHTETEKLHTETTPSSAQPKNTRVNFSGVVSENHKDKITSARVDFSGVWKRDKCENIDAYVGAQGAGFMQRKLAASMVFKRMLIFSLIVLTILFTVLNYYILYVYCKSMVHTITMDPSLSVIRIQEKAGPIDTDYTLQVDSSPVQNTLMKRVFLDR